MAASASSSSAASTSSHQRPPSSMQQFTVGKLDAGMAILLGARASLIEFPSLLLPQDVQAGSVVEISVKRNVQQEARNKRDFDELQNDILQTFGSAAPVPPQLRLRATTQTSVVLEWSPLQLATAKLISLDIHRNSTRLAPIPNPLHNTSTKLSGLEVGVEYSFHLVLKTSAGTFTSNAIRTTTHTMTNTSGISVCFGTVEGGGQSSGEPLDNGEEVSALEALARELLDKMGAKYSTKLQIDTTHYVCTSPRSRPPPQAMNGVVTAAGEGPVYRKALGLNIPVVRPEWIVACYEGKKMVPISSFYLDKEPPNISSVQNLLQARSKQSEPAAPIAGATASSPPPPAPKDEPSPTSMPKQERTAIISSGEQTGSEALTFGEVAEETAGPAGEPLTADGGETVGAANAASSGEGGEEANELHKRGDLQSQGVHEEDQGKESPGENAPNTAPSIDSESLEEVSLASATGEEFPGGRERQAHLPHDDEEAGEEVDLS